MTGPLPPIVTLKHLAEWAGYNHGVAKKQAIGKMVEFKPGKEGHLIYDSFVIR